MTSLVKPTDVNPQTAVKYSYFDLIKAFATISQYN